MSRVVAELSEITKGEAVIVADVGQHQMATARYYRFKHPNSFLTSGGLGTMGYALPAAQGAACATNGKPVVAIAGDGGLQMTLQELGTISQQNLNVKTIVLNNNFLGMVRQWQQLFFEQHYSSVEMQNPDFLKLAEAYSIPSRQVKTGADIRSALLEMWTTPGPFLLEVLVEREDNVFPMVPAGASVDEMRLE